MIPALLQIVVVVAAGIIGGFFEGKADAKRAIANDEVEHKRSVKWRALVAGLFTGFTSAAGHTPWYIGLLLLVVAFGSFNPVFRLTMNKRRKFSTWYVSPGNAYDAMFLWLSCLSNKNWPKKVTAWHMKNYYVTMAEFLGRPEDWNDCAKVQLTVHRAGRYAYAFEFSCLTLSSILFVVGVMINNS